MPGAAPRLIRAWGLAEQVGMLRFFLTPLAAAALGLAVAAGPAAAAPGIGDATSFSAKFTTKKPGLASGLTLKTTGAQPGPGIEIAPAVRQTVTLPAGTRVNVRSLPACGASPQELTDQGAQVACPASTRIGSGIAVGSLDGARAAFDLAIYAIDGKLFFAGERDGVPLKVGFEGVVRGRTIALTVPTMNGRIAPTLFRASIERTGDWLRTPKKCPAGGKWKSMATFQGLTAVDGTAVGERQTLTGTTPCRA